MHVGDIWYVSGQFWWTSLLCIPFLLLPKYGHWFVVQLACIFSAVAVLVLMAVFIAFMIQSYQTTAYCRQQLDYFNCDDGTIARQEREKNATPETRP